MPQNAASDQGLHIFLIETVMQKKKKETAQVKKSPVTPKATNGMIQMISMGKSTAQIKRVRFSNVLSF